MNETLLMTAAAWRIAATTAENVGIALTDARVDEFRAGNGGRMVRVTAHRDTLELIGKALDTAYTDPDLAAPTRACAGRTAVDVLQQLYEIACGETPERRRHRLAL